MTDEKLATYRTQLSELNIRARTYTLQMWTVPLSYLGVVAVLLAAGTEWFPLTLRQLAGSLLGIFVVAHLVGVEDGRDRAVTNLRAVEGKLGLAKTSENKPWLMWPLPAAAAFFAGFLLGLALVGVLNNPTSAPYVDEIGSLTTGEVNIQAAWISALSALGGAIIGGVVAFAGQALLRRHERKALARQVARGLAGEIAALLEIVEHRGYLKDLRAASLEENPAGLAVAVTRNYFKVFDANAGHLGLLGTDLPETVASFYVRASALVEDFNVISQPGAALYTAEVRKAFYGAMADLLEKTVAIGRNAIDDLKK